MWAVWFISMNKLKHIALLVPDLIRHDYVVSASLFGRLSVIFDNLKHNKQRLHLAATVRCDVQRFERQGQAGNCFST
jgi:hypothetical protein